MLPYFADKDAMVAAVIKMQAARVLEFQEPHLERLASVADLRRWRDAVVLFVEEGQGANGAPSARCPARSQTGRSRRGF